MRTSEKASAQTLRLDVSLVLSLKIGFSKGFEVPSPIFSKVCFVKHQAYRKVKYILQTQKGRGSTDK